MIVQRPPFRTKIMLGIRTSTLVTTARMLPPLSRKIKSGGNGV